MVSMDENHIYSDGLGNRYESVTRVIGMFQKPFDKSLVVYSAKKKGVTPEELAKEWATITLESQIYGTSVHHNIETYLEGVNSYPPKSIISLLDKLRNSGYKLLKEQVLYSEKYRVAGTADLIVEKENSISVLDWKTNKEMHKKHYNNFLKPFDYIPQTKINGYTFQLCIYAYFAKIIYGKEVDKLNIVWIDRENDRIEIIPVKYDEGLAIAILDAYSKSIKEEKLKKESNIGFLTKISDEEL
jgi:PD-(D/E)XK nuclease superfamily